MLAALLILAAPAEANDLRGRFGLGFHAGLGSVSAVSVRYAIPTKSPAVNVQLELDGGFAVASGADTELVAGGRLLYGLVAEDNLALYGAGGAHYVSAAGSDFVRVQPALGAEFFMFGLENLGFGVEWGLNVDLGESTGLRTVSGAPAVTVHYWF
ncbi:MAG: hypothetical protein FJ102_15060 [Deltaproteobacteria bacterium]|nr:hypothetical protein [Deltaproteobacteria bacterium]